MPLRNSDYFLIYSQSFFRCNHLSKILFAEATISNVTSLLLFIKSKLSLTCNLIFGKKLIRIKNIISLICMRGFRDIFILFNNQHRQSNLKLRYKL